MGSDPIARKKIGFSSEIFSGFQLSVSMNFQGIFQQFRAERKENSRWAERKENSRWLKLTIQTKTQLSVLPKFDECHHFRSSVVFTPEVRMKHVDRCWKSYPVGNKGESPKSKCGVAKC